MQTSFKPSASFRFAIGGALLLILAFAALFAAHRTAGLGGDAIALGVLSICWFAVSRMKVDALQPINSYKLTMTELLTLLALCAILYGFSVPAITTVPRGVAPSPVVPATTTLENSG